MRILPKPLVSPAVERLEIDTALFDPSEVTEIEYAAPVTVTGFKIMITNTSDQVASKGLGGRNSIETTGEIARNRFVSLTFVES